jgi:hypothetical protein
MRLLRYKKSPVQQSEMIPVSVIDRKTLQDDEFHGDAWSRFERAVDVVVKSPPQHRTKTKRKTRKSPSKPKPVKKPA